MTFQTVTLESEIGLFFSADKECQAKEIQRKRKDFPLVLVGSIVDFYGLSSFFGQFQCYQKLNRHNWLKTGFSTVKLGFRKVIICKSMRKFANDKKVLNIYCLNVHEYKRFAANG